MATKNWLRNLGGAEKAVAGIAGAASLATGSQAYATIIVRPAPSDIPNAAAPAANPGSGTQAYDFDGDGTSDFGFNFRNPQTASGTNGVVWQANIYNLVAGGGAAGYVGPYVEYAEALASGTAIGASTDWQGVAVGDQVVLGSRYRLGANVTNYGGFSADPDAPVRGFLGVRFLISGAVKYGWLDVEVRPATSAAGSGGLYFFGAAYEDSGAAIDAGAVPEPGTLGLLALGAIGLLGRRRKN